MTATAPHGDAGTSGGPPKKPVFFGSASAQRVAEVHRRSLDAWTEWNGLAAEADG